MNELVIPIVFIYIMVLCFFLYAGWGRIKDEKALKEYELSIKEKEDRIKAYTDKMEEEGYSQKEIARCDAQLRIRELHGTYCREHLKENLEKLWEKSYKDDLWEISYWDVKI